MKTRLRFSVKSLVVIIAFAALAFAWWCDHQHLAQQITESQITSEQVTKQNVMLRRTLRADRVRLDSLFGHTVAQQDAIDRLKQINAAALQRLAPSQ